MTSLASLAAVALVVTQVAGQTSWGDSPPAPASVINISWTKLGAFPAPGLRRSSSLVSLGADLILFGGETWALPADDHLLPVTADETLWRYDTEAKLWSVPNPDGPLPPVRAGHAAAARDSGSMLIHAGQTGTNMTTMLSDLWLFTVGAEKWECLTTDGDAGAPSPRAHHSLTAVPSVASTFIMYGGQSCPSVSCASDDVWKLELNATNYAQWTLLSGTGPRLFGHRSLFLDALYTSLVPPGLYVFGGVDATGHVSDTVYSGQIAGNVVTWTAVQKVSPRCFHSLELSGCGQQNGLTVIVYGGYNSSANHETLLADGSLNTFTLSSTVPNFKLSSPNDYDALDNQFSRGYQSTALVRGDSIDTLAIFGGNRDSVRFPLTGFWIYHNASAQESVNPGWTQLSSARANGAAFCESALCPSTGATVVSIGGTVQTQDPTDLPNNPPQVAVGSTLVATLNSSGVVQQSEPFLPSGSNPPSLAYFSTIQLKNGSRLVFGGLFYPEAVSPVQDASDNVELSGALYMLSGSTWESRPTDAGMPEQERARFLHCAVQYGSGKDEVMLVYGGVRTRNAGTFGDWASMLQLNTTDSTWTDLSQPESGPALPKFGHSCVSTGGNLIVFGGAATTESYKIPDHWSVGIELWQYNMPSKQWYLLRSAGVQPYSTIFHTATLAYNNSRMVVVGGLTKEPHGASDDLMPSNEVVVVDLVSSSCLTQQSLTQDTNAQCTWLQSRIQGVGPENTIMRGRYGHSTLPVNSSTQDAHSLLITGGVSDPDQSPNENDIWQLTLTEYYPPPATPSGHDSTILGLSWVAFSLIIAAFFVLVGASVLGWRWHRRRQRYLSTQKLLADLNKRSGQGALAYGDADEDSQGNLLSVGAGEAEWEADFADYLADAQDFVVDFEALRIVKQIGHGATSVVHVGWWENKPVAIKRYFLNQNFQFKDFCRETLVHRHLKHHNVLDLHAITVNPPCSVTPLMRFGSLFHLLQSAQELSYPVVLQLAHDSASGMAYLHSQGVLHRDLKTLNLLIDDAWCVKVADFGTSRFQVSAMTTGIGSVQYMAPEVFVSNHTTTKADVYSFAIILWEMLTRQVPYGEISSPFIVCCDVRNGLRLEIPADAKPGYSQLIEECWAQNANERPSFQEILVKLDEMTEQAKQEAEYDPAEFRHSRTGRDSFKQSFQDITDLKKLMSSSTATGHNSDASSYLSEGDMFYQGDHGELNAPIARLETRESENRRG